MKPYGFSQERGAPSDDRNHRPGASATAAVFDRRAGAHGCARCPDRHLHARRHCRPVGVPRLHHAKEPMRRGEYRPAGGSLLWGHVGKEPGAVTAHAMDVAFTLHAGHEFSAPSLAGRVAAGTYVDLHSSMVAAFATLKGPRHG